MEKNSSSSKDELDSLLLKDPINVEIYNYFKSGLKVIPNLEWDINPPTIEFLIQYINEQEAMMSNLLELKQKPIQFAELLFGDYNGDDWIFR